MRQPCPPFLRCEESAGSGSPAYLAPSKKFIDILECEPEFRESERP
jgi:hypothetical protein